jgi:hypothetical protein
VRTDAHALCVARIVARSEKYHRLDVHVRVRVHVHALPLALAARSSNHTSSDDTVDARSVVDYSLEDPREYPRACMHPFDDARVRTALDECADVVKVRLPRAMMKDNAKSWVQLNAQGDSNMAKHYTEILRLFGYYANRVPTQRSSDARPPVAVFYSVVPHRPPDSRVEDDDDDDDAMVDAAVPWSLHNSTEQSTQQYIVRAHTFEAAGSDAIYSAPSVHCVLLSSLTRPTHLYHPRRSRRVHTHVLEFYPFMHRLGEWQR